MSIIDKILKTSPNQGEMQVPDDVTKMIRKIGKCNCPIVSDVLLTLPKTTHLFEDFMIKCGSCTNMISNKMAKHFRNLFSGCTQKITYDFTKMFLSNIFRIYLCHKSFTTICVLRVKKLVQTFTFLRHWRTIASTSVRIPYMHCSLK